MPLIERVINGFYFEIEEVAHGVIRIAAFVTPEKPNVTSNPVPNEQGRIRVLSEMFGKLRELKEYGLDVEEPAHLTSADKDRPFLVAGIRANISKRDRSPITIEEAVKLIETNLRFLP